MTLLSDMSKADTSMLLTHYLERINRTQLKTLTVKKSSWLCINLPITEARLVDIQQTTDQDSQLQRLRQFIEQGWPSGYWKVRENLCIADSLILLGDCLVIPASRQTKVLQSIHEGHLGIEKCKSRAKMCVYWPNINDSIEQLVQFVTNLADLTRKNHYSNILCQCAHGKKLGLTISQ